MNYILHRSGTGRFLLQSADTGHLIGLVIQPAPTESRQMFAYDVGATLDRHTLVNVDQFPELENLSFFAIEYPSYYDFSTYLNNADSHHIHHLVLAAGKFNAFNGRHNQPPLPHSLELLWQHTPQNPVGLWKMPAWGLWVGTDGVWFGNRQGIVLKLNHDGAVCQEWNLPKNAAHIWVTQGMAYSTCDDGYIYDLSGKLPEIFYQARWDRVSVWSDFRLDGLTGIATPQTQQQGALSENYLYLVDNYGKISQIQYHSGHVSAKRTSSKWEQKTEAQQTWFFATDGKQIYQGHRQGVNAYDCRTGKVIWCHTTETEVLCGVLANDGLIVGCSDRWLYQLAKDGDLKAQTTAVKPWFQCEGGVYAVTQSDDGAYIFAADHEAYLYALTNGGELLWRKPMGCGAALNLQWYDGRIYATTTEGTLAAFVMDSATMQTLTQNHQRQNAPTQAAPVAPISNRIQPVIPPVTETNLESVIVECILVGNKTRVRVISAGYHRDWSVQFPTKLREVGAKYRVSQIRPVTGKNFYRASGTIERIDGF